MRSHREFLAWQRARAVTIEVHRYADSRWTRGRASAIEQVRRSALSTELNLAEGWALGPGPQCRQHFRVAYGSAVETTEVLGLLAELDPDNQPVLQPIIRLSREAQALTLLLFRKTPARAG